MDTQREHPLSAQDPELVSPTPPPASLEPLDTASIVRHTEEIQTASEAATELDPAVPGRSGFNILAAVSLVLALALSPLAVVFGYIAAGQARRAHQHGEAIAWVAVVLGWLVLVGWTVAGITAWIIWSEL